MRQRSATGDRLAGAIWLALIAWLTLRSAPNQAATVAQSPWYCIECGSEGAADFLLNVLLFFPLGIAARRAGWSVRRLVAFGFAVSASIELIQGVVLIGRDASLGDVLANTVGALVGWLAVPALASLRLPSHARRAAWIALTLGTIAWLLGGRGTRPALDDQVRWEGRILPRSDHTDAFDGSIDAVVVNGTRVVDGLVTGTGGDPLTVTVRLRRNTTAPSRRAARLVKVTDARGDIEIEASQVGLALVIQARLAASHWRLHTPGWRVEDALRIPPHQPWVFTWTWNRDGVILTSHALNDSGPGVATRLPISVATGWVFIHPFVADVSASAPLWTALWIAWWFGLLGWLAGTAGWRTASSLGLAGLAIFAGASWYSRLAPLTGELALGAAAFALAAAIAMAWPPSFSSRQHRSGPSA